ncbi:MAG: hypothetical protein QOE33_1609 [Acidobacteriota bacterium]|jgi:hypothetical protein|nr:hypothetical protein [Acidobacteriota bacterium]
MFRFSKLTLAAVALFALSLAAATTKAAPISYLDPTVFATAAGSTTSNDFQGETVSSPVNYQPSLTSMGIKFTASSGNTVGFVSGASSSNFGLATGNTALFLNGSGGFLGSTLTITPLADTTAFGFYLKPSGDTTIPPGSTTTGEYTVVATDNLGNTFTQVVSSNDFNTFSFVGFTTTPGSFLTSIVISTTAGSTPLIDNLSFNGTPAAPTATPEPATLMLFGTGLIGLASVARKRHDARKGVDDCVEDDA